MRIAGSTIVCVCVFVALSAPPTVATARLDAQRITIHYRAASGVLRAAVVLVPSWTGNADDGPLPLVISPHGRGLSGRENSRMWGNLPDDGGFVVVNPDGQGRELQRLSWGYAGQIDDLARMPQIVERALPWLRIDRSRIYAIGGSMGGQEALLLAAQHQRLLAGAAAFDATADFALQYRNFVRQPCGRACRRVWGKPMGLGLRKLARVEVGGSPAQRPRAYAWRSPLTYARMLARACLPLELWWSNADAVVRQQRLQSERLFRRIRRVNPRAPVSAFIGSWHHSHEMRRFLPYALARFGLLQGFDATRVPAVHAFAQPPDAC